MVRADGWSECARTARYPGSRILALVLCLPVARAPASLDPRSTVAAGGTAGAEDDAPRLQWRHRVGFPPTSRGRRACVARRFSRGHKRQVYTVVRSRSCRLGSRKRGSRTSRETRRRRAAVVRGWRAAVPVSRYAGIGMAGQSRAGAPARRPHVLQLQHQARGDQRLRRQLPVLLVRAPAAGRSRARTRCRSKRPGTSCASAPASR